MRAISITTLVLLLALHSGPTRAMGFDPGHQEPLTYRDREIALTLLGRGGSFAIGVEASGASPRKLHLPKDIAQVNTLRRTGHTKAVVIGMVNGDVSKVVVIDLENGKIGDQFLAYWPALSPDGRYVAFAKFYPPHFVEGPSDEYLLYDLDADAAKNRVGGTGVDNAINIGTAVFPIGARNAEADNVGIPDNAAHAMASDFFWSAKT
jgi:hypothetical protein